MISSAGIGSGLEVDKIIRQLMALERQPLNRLEDKKSGFETQLSAYGKLKSSVAEFESALADLDSNSDFKLFSASSEDEDIYTASANSNASISTYDIKVNTLAEAHKMGSASFGDKDTTTIGNSGDTMTITIGSDSLEVDIGAKTLEQIRDAINDAVNAAANDSDDTNDVEATASIVKEDGSNYYLTLTSDNTGTDNAMSLSFADSGGSAITDPLSMTTTNSAVDSEISIDGTYTVTRSSNTVTDAIEGVTLNLKSVDSSNAYTLDVDRDVSAITDVVQKFVDAYNDLRSTMEDLRTGDLRGDSTIVAMERRVLDEINTKASGIGSYSYLAEVGVSIQESGKMSLDASDLEDALNTDFDSVADLFGDSSEGFAVRLKSIANDFQNPDGVIDAREDGLNSSINRTEARIDQAEHRLETTEQRLRRQFTSLDQLMAGLQTTSNFLSQQLSGL